MNSDSKNTFFERHRRALSLTGLLLVFVTFVVKDAVRERLKDSIDSIHAAESLYLIRTDTFTITALIQNVDKHIGSITGPADHPGSTEKRTARETLLEETKAREDLYTALESLLENTSRVVETLPRPKLRREQLLALKCELDQIRGLDNEAHQVTSDYYKNLNIDDVLQPDQPRKEQVVLAKEAEADYALFSRTYALLLKANQAMNDVIREARTSYQSEERLYTIFTYVGYALYALGWSLTAIGQLTEPRVQLNPAPLE